MIRQMGLDRFPPFFKDPIFLLAAAGAVLFWIVLGRSVDRHPIHPRDLLSRHYLSLILLQPFVEELLFRGFLQGQWLQTAWGSASRHGITVANLITSLLFVASHFISHPAGWAVAVFFPSMIFGYLRDRHDSLYPAMVLHMFYNAGYFYLTGLP